MSKGDNVPDIQILTSQARQLEESFARWNSVAIALLAATAFVAVTYFVVTFVANRKGIRLKDAQTALIRAKDEQLAGDLKDKDLRIAEAGSDAARANEKARTLEQANLILRNDLNEAASKVAGIQKDAAHAQKDAADAKATQQRVEVEWARQKERAAIAEGALLELQEKLKPRVLSPAQRTRLIDSLKRVPKGPVEILHVEADREAFEFAEQIRNVLRNAGWDTGVRTSLLGVNVVGILIAVRDAKTAAPYATAIQRSFAAASIELRGAEDAGLPEGTVRIIVGHKP